jgi:hypothetical protein
MGAQAAGRIHPPKICAIAAAIVNPDARSTKDDFNVVEEAGRIANVRVGSKTAYL